MREPTLYRSQIEDVEKRSELLFPDKLLFNMKQAAAIMQVDHRTIGKKWPELFERGVTTSKRIAWVISKGT